MIRMVQSRTKLSVWGLLPGCHFHFLMDPFKLWQMVSSKEYIYGIVFHKNQSSWKLGRFIIQLIPSKYKTLFFVDYWESTEEWL